MVRMHVVLPEDLVRAVDALAGKRKRSRFIEDAIRDKLKREAVLAALVETAGVLSGEEHPDWLTGERTGAWVKESRVQSDNRSHPDHRSGSLERG